MGPKNTKELEMNGLSHHRGQHKEMKIEEEKVSKSTFEYISIIGKGGFGKVWKVYSRKNRMQYALKEMSKAKIIDKRSEKSVKYERDLLARMHHPFIVNMHFAFQDTDNWYIIMDLLTGGDWRYHVYKYKKFTEEQTTCIILGLEYTHINNIIHRDIKPENLVLDNKGYVKMTDYGIAKMFQKENASETSGTPGYMAPEVMCAQNHTHAVDYFALGVIGYEFMNGERPYTGKTRKDIKNKIMAKQAQVKKHEIPNGWSIESADFINRLLQRKPCNRLGFNGVGEIKEHSWFKYYPWKDWYLGKINSPFIPNQTDNYDFKYCNKPDRMSLATQERYITIMSNSQYQNIFKDFDYFNREAEEQNTNATQTLQKFKNPHIVYYEEIEGTWNENDASIINRNILSNKTTDDEWYPEIRKLPRSSSTLYKWYTNNQKNFPGSWNISKNDVSLNSSYSSKRRYWNKSKSQNY